MRAGRPACVVIIVASLAAPLGGIGQAAPAAPAAVSAPAKDLLAAYLPTRPMTFARTTTDQSADLEEEVRAEMRRAALPVGTVRTTAAVRPAAAASAAPKREGGLRGRATALFAEGFLWPARGAVTSLFGWRHSRQHNGIDIAASYGTPIHAAQAGRVSYVGWHGGYGRTVILDHGDGLTTLYGHASRLLVSAGQTVVAGQEIARVGSSGFSQGPHLHFEIRLGGRPVDPLRGTERAVSAASRPAFARSKPAPGGAYYVQVGAFRLAQNARTRAREVGLAGFEAVITRTSSLYLVRLGGYPDRGSSDRAVGDLRALGFEAFVTR